MAPVPEWSYTRPPRKRYRDLDVAVKISKQALFGQQLEVRRRMTKESCAHRADRVPRTQTTEIPLPMRSVVGSDDRKEAVPILTEKLRDDLLYRVALQVPEEKQPIVFVKR